MEPNKPTEIIAPTPAVSSAPVAEAPPAEVPIVEGGIPAEQTSLATPASQGAPEPTLPAPAKPVVAKPRKPVLAITVATIFFLALVALAYYAYTKST
jgi:hypothetical protein